MPPTPRQRSTLTLLLAFAAACGRADEVIRPDVDGPVFITAAGDSVLMHEVLRIGQPDGPDHYTFSFIVWLLPTPDGGLFLYDLESESGSGENGRIRQFDAEGRFVRYVGRPGEGPGEYSSFPDARLLPDGNLLIVDQSLARMTRYDTAGNLVASWPGPTSIVELQPSTDGGWYVGWVTGHPERTPRRIEYVRFDSAGREVGRFPAPAVYHEGPNGGGGAVDIPTSYVAILPDGRMVSARNDSLRIIVTGPTGEVSRSAPHQPVRYLPEEAAARRAQFAAAARRRGGDTRPIEVPEFKPVMTYLYTDGAGRIWVRLRAPGYLGDSTASLRPGQSRWREPFEAVVFDSSLTYLGRLVTPRRAQGAILDEGAAWLVEEGASGALHVTKWVPEVPAW